MRQLRVLVGCECSGRVRDQFAALGWEAWSADLLECEVPSHITVQAPDRAVTDADAVRSGNHYQGDVLDLFNPEHPVNDDRFTDLQCNYESNLWDLIIAHPPCDHLSYAGARWFSIKQADGRQQAAAEFFMRMVNSPSPLVAVENPHSIMQKLYRPPDQSVQPWWFGDPYVKRTDWWLKGLPKLIPAYRKPDFPQLFRVTTGGGSWRTDKAAGRRAMNLLEDSEGRRNRARVRNRTMPGLAFHVAAQWGAFAEEYYGPGSE